MTRSDYDYLTAKTIKKGFKTLDDIQEHLDKFGHFILDKYVHAPNMSVMDFITKLLTNNDVIKCNYVTRGKFDDYKTWTIVSNTNDGVGRMRSLADIYLICKKYYPDISLLDVCKILNNLYTTTGLDLHYCWVVRKRVFYITDRNNRYYKYDNGQPHCECEFQLNFPYDLNNTRKVEIEPIVAKF